MTDARSVTDISDSPAGTGASGPGTATPTAGPTVSFGFNLGKIPDAGEDADPILRDGPDLALLAVFDGMGGAGGTVYETPDGPRSGAYLASRIARDVVEERMLNLLVPDWNLNGAAAAEDLRRSVQEALQDRLAELHAPKSGLRSRLLRALPTTMAVLALQRTQRGGSTWLCHVFWAGDSRAYVFEPDGARQLSTDDLRDPSDAMANLRRDSVVSNALSADTEFQVNYRRVELSAPFLLVCATDGCFGYVPSPMHFERLVLSGLQGARTMEGWSRAVQDEVSCRHRRRRRHGVDGCGCRPERTEGAVRPPDGRARRSIHRTHRRAGSLGAASRTGAGVAAFSGSSRRPSASGSVTSRATSATCTGGRTMIRPNRSSTVKQQISRCDRYQRETDLSRPPRAAPRIVRRLSS